MDINDPYFQNQIAAQLRPTVTGCVAGSVDGPGDEKELQQECEDFLVMAGYRRLTQKNMVEWAMKEVAGWFGHWPQAEGNPIMADLVVFSPFMATCLHVELKTRKRFSRAQKAMITSKRWRVAFTAQEFANHLNEWEGKKS